MFGFYPSDLYWRPVLVFVLLLVAVAPVLFADYVSSKVLYFSMLFPFVAVWLLWGGPIWGPLLALAGFVVAYLVFRFTAAVIPPALGLLLGTVAAVLWWLVLSPALNDVLSSTIPLGIEQVQSRQFGGFMLSITIGVTAILCSLPLGILLALGRRSDLPLVKSICVGFIEFIRGVPLITLLFVASVLLNIFLPPGTTFDIILRVMIMVTLFASAYMAEVIRGGLAALPKGQYEGADSLGLDLLAGAAAHHHAAGAEDLDPGHRLDLHRRLQGYDAGVDHLDVRPDRAFQRHPRRHGLERHLLGAVHLHRRRLLRLLFLHVALLDVPGAQASDRPSLTCP